jgi:PhnB protein
MRVEPYLNFNGRCAEALEFYKLALDAKVTMLMHFKDCPDPQPGMIPPGTEDKVMHASMLIGQTRVMASDGRCSGHTDFNGINLSLSVDSEAEADKTFNALADGGKVTMPLTKTFYSPRFGMVTDRFGVSWMVIVQQ